MISGTPHRFKAIAAFNQMRVYIVNSEIAVNVIPRTFVTADYDRSTSQVGPTAHADKALIGFCGNPIAPSLQIVGFLHDFKARFTKRTATIFFECDSVELVRFSRHAVLFATSRATPGAVLLVRLDNCISELPKIVCSLGHENCHRIRILQVLANARGIRRHHNFSSIATRRRSAKALGFHVKCEKQHRSRIRFRARPNPLGLRIGSKTVQSTAARHFIVCVRKRRCATPLREVASLIFPCRIPYERFRFPAGTGIIRFIKIVNLHQNAGSAITIHAHDRNCIFARQECHRDKTHTPSLVVFGQKCSIVVKPVTAISHNPNARPLARIVSRSNQLRTDFIATTVSGLRRKIHDLRRRNRRMYRRNSKNRDNARQNQTVRQITKPLNTHTFLTF